MRIGVSALCNKTRNGSAIVKKCPKSCGADFQVRVAWRAWKPAPHAQRSAAGLEARPTRSAIFSQGLKNRPYLPETL